MTPSLARPTLFALASAIGGLENHEARMAEPEYAIGIKRNALLLLEYHALLGIAARLDLLVRDAEPSAIFDVIDLADGALRSPLHMPLSYERRLLKNMRERLANSPIAKIEITQACEVVLWAFVYDEELRKSVRRPVMSSAEMTLRRTA